MVKTLLRGWVALLLCVLCVLSASTWAAGLQLQAARTSMVLGEALTVTLHASNLGVPLDGINLAPLQADFDIYTRSIERQSQRVHGHDEVTETLSMVLYPLHGGRLTLPALQLAGHSSRPVKIEVNAEGGDVPRVQFDLNLAPRQPMTRQVAELTLDIYDDGSLQWAPIRLAPLPGVYLRELAATERPVELAGVSRTLHRQRWALMPLRPGKVSIQFGMADALKFGHRLRYAMPGLTLEALPAPAYLPVSVPIGRVTATSRVPSGSLQLNQPYNWVMQVRGKGLSADSLARLLPTLPNSSALRFYPAQISVLPDTTQALEQVWQVSTPFVPLQAGTVRLPERVLTYFDPASGRLEAHVIRPADRVVVNPLWARLARIGLLVLALLLGLLALYWSGRRWRRWWLRYASLQGIQRALDVVGLKQAVLNFDWGDGRLPASHLLGWQQQFNRRFSESAALSGAIARLDAACYGKSDETVSMLRPLLWKALAGIQGIKNGA
jgi:hypothetical protein